MSADDAKGDAGGPPIGGGCTWDGATDIRSFVEGMRLAATAARDLRSHADRVVALELLVARSPSRRRAHVAALSEAALEAEASWRTSIGLPSMETRLFAGWIDLPSTTTIDGGAPIGERATRPDAADAFPRAAAIMRALQDLPAGSEEADRSWDRLEGIAFARCFDTSASCLGGMDRRRTLLILWSALRRRRPLAAAVLRRCLTLDRTWRASAAGARP